MAHVYLSGSCATSVPQQVTKAHPANQLGCDAFRIGHGFICRHVEMQVLLVNTPECTQVGPKRRTRALTGVAMHFTSAIPISIARPFVHTMGNSGMAGMTAAITPPFVGIEQCAIRGHVVSNQVVAGVPVRMVADPPALLSCVA